MHRQFSQRWSDSAWLLQMRDLVPEESVYWFIEWGVMQLLHRRQIAKRTQPQVR